MSLSKPRKKVYTTSSTTLTTIEEIKLKIEPFFLRLLVSDGGWRYPSFDMKKGINVESLLQHSEVLKALIMLDPRGAFFGQKNLTEVLKLLSEDEKYQTAFLTWIANIRGSTTKEKGVLEIAYAIRVMLAHLRRKRNAYAKLDNKDFSSGHPPQLVEIYGLFSVTPTSKKAVQNPFIYFRDEEDNCGDSDVEDEDDIPVCKSLVQCDDGFIVGRLRLSSGAVEDCKSYTEDGGCRSSV